MNIKERQGVITQQSDIFRIGGKVSTNQSADPTQYWNALSRPPIRYYLPDWVIQRLWDYAKSPRIANDPVKKFKMTNELLKPFGFEPLASGTNRRAFYCKYDPHIVLKTGSDDVGIKDNKSEFEYTQHIIKPFCPKVFGIDGDGVVSLMERGEPMSESQYKNLYSRDIFKIFMILLQRGYVLEDAGSNYYKNFGIRLGFGPIIWDFPYVCKVDYKKLKCTHPDPITHEICGGEIDYNYNKGMNELICTKCGVRYSAKYLEDQTPSELYTPIEKERGKIMGIINTNFKINIKRGDKIVARLYDDETKTQESITKEVVTESNPIVDAAKNTGIKMTPEMENLAAKQYNDNIQRPAIPKKEGGMPTHKPALKVDSNGRKYIEISEEKYQEIVNSGKKRSKPIKTIGEVDDFENYYRDGKEYCKYPSSIHNQLMQLLNNIREKHGDTVANFMADKLGVNFLTKEELLEIRKRKEAAKEARMLRQLENATSKLEKEPKEEEQPAVEETAPSNEPKIIHKEEILQAQKDVASEIGGTLIYSDASKNKPVDIIIPPARPVQSVSSDPDRWQTRKIEDVESDKTKDVEVKQEEPVQTTGLFPIKPKTPEEIEAEEAKNNQESAVMGFPGVPVVETIRFKQQIPLVKNMIHARFDKFMLDIKDTDTQMRKMEEDIKQFIKTEVADIMGTDDSGIVVKVTRTADHRNTDCFQVDITNNQSPVLTTLLYPDNKAVDELLTQDMPKEEPTEDEELDEDLNKEIFDFLSNTVKEFDASDFNNVKDVEDGVRAFLYAKVADAYKKKVNVAKLFKMTNEYVDTQINISEPVKEEEKKETVESQL